MIEVVLGVVVVAGSVGWRLLGDSPVVPVELWQAVTYTGCAVLGLGLVRDLAIIARRRGEKPPPPRRAGRAASRRTWWSSSGGRRTTRT